MADLIVAHAFCGFTERRAGWPALLDAVELRGDELLGVDRVFGDCQPEGLGEIVEVVEGLYCQLVCDVLGKLECHVSVSLLIYVEIIPSVAQ